MPFVTYKAHCCSVAGDAPSSILTVTSQARSGGRTMDWAIETPTTDAGERATITAALESAGASGVAWHEDSSTITGPLAGI